MNTKTDKIEGAAPETPQVELWQDEFGKEFEPPREILELVRIGKLIDQSWHNDVCPSFSPAWDPSGEEVRLWSDAIKPEDRECQGFDRFGVTLYDGDGGFQEEAVRTNDVGAALEAFLKIKPMIRAEGGE
jgi:hypothetical protein